MRDAFKNLKWSRVVSLEGWEDNSTQAWDMGPDIVAELEAMEDISPSQLAKLEPAFDPLAFQQLHSEWDLHTFELDAGRLQALGE